MGLLEKNWPKKEGWIVYPSDGTRKKGRRTEWWGEESFSHPSRNNTYMVEDIIDTFTKPGDTILDPMGGVGTTLMACLMGRNVVMLDVEKTYHEIQKQAYNRMQERQVGLDGQPTTVGNSIIILGDCRKILPIPCDHVVFSPPYSGTMDVSGAESGREMERKMGYDFSQYQASKDNLERLNPFLYMKAMEKVYKLLYDSIRPGGTLTVILRDFARQQQRTFLSDWANRVLIRTGFKMLNWDKRWAQGTMFLVVREKQGSMGIHDEDILTFIKE